jgi:hypothetical protein
MREDIDDISIPSTHHAILDNSDLLDKLVLKRLKGWTSQDVHDYLTEKGYRSETISRFVKAVELRYQRLMKSRKKPKKKQEVEDTGELPVDKDGNHIRDNGGENVDARNT